jgi:hypothetical protein
MLTQNKQSNIISHVNLIVNTILENFENEHAFTFTKRKNYILNQNVCNDKHRLLLSHTFIEANCIFVNLSEMHDNQLFQNAPK